MRLARLEIATIRAESRARNKVEHALTGLPAYSADRVEKAFLLRKEFDQKVKRFNSKVCSTSSSFEDYSERRYSPTVDKP